MRSDGAGDRVTLASRRGDGAGALGHQPRKGDGGSANAISPHAVGGDGSGARRHLGRMLHPRLQTVPITISGDGPSPDYWDGADGPGRE